MKHKHNTVLCYMVTGPKTKTERHPLKCYITKKKKKKKKKRKQCSLHVQLWGVIKPAAHVATEYLIISVVHCEALLLLAVLMFK